MSGVSIRDILSHDKGGEKAPISMMETGAFLVIAFC